MTPLTKQHLLDVGDRSLDEGYIQPIRDVGPGYELYQGSAAVAARCSQAVARFHEDVYILTARGGVLATVQVTFFREHASAGAGTVLSGTVVMASARGAAFVTMADAVFGAADLTATAPAQALGYGYEWNILGPFVDPQGNTWPGELDTVALPLQDPVFWDPSIRCRNDAPADGLGRPATLDVIGSERSVKRNTSESDPSYRARIRALPDTVTPAAIRRQLRNYFRTIPGLFYRLVETWQHEYQECYDAPDALPTVVEPYDALLCVYDDPRDESPFRNRYLDETDYLAAFVVEMDNPPAFADTNMVWDDDADSFADTATVVGGRTLSAFDVTPDFPDALLSPAYDGGDAGLDDYLARLFDLLDSIKAAGVHVAIVVRQL